MVDLLASLLMQEQLADYRLHGDQNHMLQPVTNGKPKLSHENDCINDGSWRIKIAGWAYEVIDYFDFEREAVAIALNFVDRFMAINHRKNINITMNKRDYQLLTVTALFLAIKIHGVSSDHRNAGAKLTLRVFVELSQHRFTGSDIEGMELTLLDKLKWKLNPPLPVNFIGCLMDLFPQWQTRNGHCTCQNVRSAIYKGARYLSEISVFVTEIAFLFSPLVLGYAAILISMDDLFETIDRSISEFLPYYGVVEQFLRNIFNATSLSPGTEDVSRARSMLTDVCSRVSHQPANTTIRRGIEPNHCSTSTHQWIPPGNIHVRGGIYQDRTDVDPKRGENVSPIEIEHDFDEDSSATR
jgi:Cyclin, N-terminal domain